MTWKPFRRPGPAGKATIGILIAVALVGCSSATASTESSSANSGQVAIGAHSNGAASPTTLSVPVVQSIRSELPQSVRDSGKLVIGIGALPSGSPPLSFTGDDQHTLTGSEPDFGRLVAAVFGLQPDVENATWDNLFVGIDTGKTDIGFSNIGVTEQRKEKYDFATYRKGFHAFEVLKSNSWNFDGNYENLADQTVAVSSGTNQEKILLAWKAKLKSEGKDFQIKYYPDEGSTTLALNSGKIDAIFQPNPTVQYAVTESANSANPKRNAGVYSSAGASVQGLVAGTTKKGDGLVQPLDDAINYLIKNGQYAAWLKAYNLSNEAVDSSQINPPGLPKSNT